MKNSSFPSMQEANDLLDWALQENPGIWGDHVRTAARAAASIASQSGMNEERCYILALLHDIGRYKGPSGLAHTLAGYRLLMAAGWEKPALICLTHSFPIKDIAYFNGLCDCSLEDTKEITAILSQCEYDDEIRLIQLCDAISLPGGVTIMEKRLADVMMRHGANETTPIKWRAFFDLKRHFDQLCGQSVSALFQEEILSDIF